MDSSALIDRIYEAAAIPELWIDVLEGISRMTGGAGASFVTGGGIAPMRWVATPVIDDLIRDFGRNPHPNPRISDVMIRRFPGFVTDHDMFPDPVIEQHPFYTEFMRPRGFGWCGGTAFFPPSADPIVLAIEKHYADGPFERRFIPFLDSIRPHLARATMLSAQLALQRAQTTVQTLQIVGLPAAILDPRRRIRAANDLFQSYIPDTVLDMQDRVRLADPASDVLLEAALAQAAQNAGEVVGSIPVRARAVRHPIVFHLLPVRRSARDIFSDGGAILVATPVVPTAGADAGLLEALFDLTPSEAQVAKLIGEGETIDDIAVRLAISRNTVRTHLRSVFFKTATGRQASLVRLLSTLKPKV